MIPQSFIQDLLNRVDIVDVVGRYVQLKKGGANFMGLCPFHNEKSPSFTVSPTKQFYHCFGCGAHGTAISFLIEYSGMAFAMFFLAEYANMILVSTLASVMFLGGWMAPVSFSAFGLHAPAWIEQSMWFWNWFWLFVKTFVVVTMFLWVRATFPRFRYDQIMRLGWKIFIPLTLVWLVVVGLWIESPWTIWK